VFDDICDGSAGHSVRSTPYFDIWVWYLNGRWRDGKTVLNPFEHNTLETNWNNFFLQHGGLQVLDQRYVSLSTQAAYLLSRQCELSPEQQEFFVEHGWLKIPNAIDPKYIDGWMEDFWVRLGWDKDDKSTWKEEYLKMPRHREVETYKFCPDAWKAMCECFAPPATSTRFAERSCDAFRTGEIVGGEDKIDPVMHFQVV
jgi:hypothetical protein